MLLFNRYEYNSQTDLIGKGGFSRVYKAFDNKFKRYLALKIYKTNEFSERYGPIAEIHRVIELDHPNIARYLDFDEMDNEDSLGQQEKIQVCVMELLEGGNLAKYYNTHKDLNVFKKLLVDVLHGLSYLHKNGIIHRDIKPANILIKNTVEGPIAKITDFGISKRSDASSNSSNSALIVSIPYIAPEQLNLRKYGIDEKIHYNIDLWALGVAVYEIITGEVLFKNSNHESSEQVMANIISTELPEKIKLVPSPFKEFVSLCVVKDAKFRIKSAEELLPILLDNIYNKVSKTEFQRELEPGKHLESKPADDVNTAYGDSYKAGDISPSGNNENELPAQPDKEKNESDDGEETIAFSLPAKRTEPAGPVGQRNDDFNEERMLLEAEQVMMPGTAAASPVGTDALDERTIITPSYTPPGEGKTPDLKAGDEIVILEAGEGNAFSGQAEQKFEGSDERVPAQTFSPDEPGKITRFVELLQSSPHQIDIIDPKQATTQEKKLKAGEQRLEDKRALASEQTSIVSGIPKDMEAGKVSLFNRYDYVPLTDLIGKGGFSRVYKAYDKKLSRWVALKIYKTGEFADRYSAIAEIKRVINLDHSNICRYLDIEEIEKENPFGENEKIQVCVMELLDGGNFAHFYHKSDRDPEVLKKLLRDVLNGISYLHKNGIIHRDIKPANILIKRTMEGPLAKITDFGISKLSDSVNSNSSSALIVSIPYMAPEQLNPRKYGIKEKISYNLDLWSLGVTIFEVMTGHVLFKNSEQDSSEQIMANIMAPELPGKINELPQPFRSIVACCIVKNANERAQKAEELLVLLNSTFNDIAPKPILETEKPDLPTPVPDKTIPSVSGDAEPSPNSPKKKAPKISASVNEPAKTKDQWKKFTVVESTHELEKKARKHLGYLKISVAVAALVFIAILLFYLFADGRS